MAHENRGTPPRIGPVPPVPPESKSRRAAEAAKALAERLWDEATDRTSPHWPPRWLKAAAVVAGLVLLIYLVIPILLAISRVLSGEYERTGDVTWQAGSDLARVVTDPVQAWLLAGSADLPVGGHLLWTLWCAIGIALFVLGTLTVRGARVGWLLFGIGTAAMVYAGTPTRSAWAAVGVTAVWWTLGALFVLRRSAAPRLKVEAADDADRDEAERDACDLLDALAATHALADPRDDTADRIRRVRTALLTMRAYPPADRGRDDVNRWRERFAPPVPPIPMDRPPAHV